MKKPKKLPSNPYNPLTWIAGKPNIGKNVWIGAFCLIDAGHNTLTISDGCNIASGAQILTHSTVKRCISEGKYNKIDSKPTKIGKFCFIGANAVVLMGCNIGNHSIVAAGAVIAQNSIIPPYSIVAGVPARIIGNSRKYQKV